MGKTYHTLFDIDQYVETIRGISSIKKYAHILIRCLIFYIIIIMDINKYSLVNIHRVQQSFCFMSSKIFHYSTVLACGGCGGSRCWLTSISSTSWCLSAFGDGRWHQVCSTWSSATQNDYVYMRTNNAIISNNQSKDLIALWCLHVKSKALGISQFLLFAKNCG